MGRITFAQRGFTPLNRSSASRKTTASSSSARQVGASGKARGSSKSALSSSGKPDRAASTSSYSPTTTPTTAKRSKRPTLLRADLDGLGTLPSSLLFPATSSSASPGFRKRRTTKPAVGKKGRTKMAVAALNRRELERREAGEGDWTGVEVVEIDDEDEAEGQQDEDELLDEEDDLIILEADAESNAEHPPTPRAVSPQHPPKSSLSSSLSSTSTSNNKKRKHVQFADEVWIQGEEDPSPMTGDGGKAKRVAGSKGSGRKRRKVDRKRRKGEEVKGEESRGKVGDWRKRVRQTLKEMQASAE